MRQQCRCKACQSLWLGWVGGWWVGGWMGGGESESDLLSRGTHATGSPGHIARRPEHTVLASQPTVIIRRWQTCSCPARLSSRHRHLHHHHERGCSVADLCYINPIGARLLLLGSRLGHESAQSSTVRTQARSLALFGASAPPLLTTLLWAWRRRPPSPPSSFTSLLLAPPPRLHHHHLLPPHPSTTHRHTGRRRGGLLLLTAPPL